MVGVAVIDGLTDLLNMQQMREVGVTICLGSLLTCSLVASSGFLCTPSVSGFEASMASIERFHLFRQTNRFAVHHGVGNIGGVL